MQAEVEQRRRDRPAIDEKVVFLQMQPARAHHHHRNLFVQAIFLAGMGIVIGQLATGKIEKVGVGIQHVLPGRRQGIFQVSHENIGAGIQRIDHHLAGRRAGNLDPPVLQQFRHRRDLPVALADGPRVGAEIGQFALVQPALRELARFHLGAAPIAKKPFQHGDKLKSLDREDKPLCRGHRACDRQSRGQVPDGPGCRGGYLVRLLVHLTYPSSSVSRCLAFSVCLLC